MIRSSPVGQPFSRANSEPVDPAQETPGPERTAQETPGPELTAQEVKACQAAATRRRPPSTSGSGGAELIRRWSSSPSAQLNVGPGSRATPARSAAWANAVAQGRGNRTHSEAPPAGRSNRHCG